MKLPTVERGGVFDEQVGRFSRMPRQRSAICEGMLRAASGQASLASEVGVGGWGGAGAHSARLRRRRPLLDQGSSSQVVFPTSGQGIYAALLDLDGAKAKPAPAQRDDDAFSALAGFAQTVVSRNRRRRSQKVAASRQDDAVFAELAEFAQRVGAKPTSLARTARAARRGGQRGRRAEGFPSRQFRDRPRRSRCRQRPRQGRPARG